ncbi:WbuC family cupin fold metalloprotein [Halosquirtibacter laminarini]|uniref:WbuC family cupin fold metalloprotein n=1 Tax=Halosquirtibacter laminarini TaxID=3374600 RepID=A0AC61NFB0_9BACT|nr:WbuC family cupin fold metalloprotein [Prolixibacteraceae bacterium]
MEWIDKTLLDKVCVEAKASPRKRMNYNFHDSSDAKLQRMLNALQPGTYLRPHRHLTPEKDEVFILLRGKMAVFFFDDEGDMTDMKVVDPLNGKYGVDIPAGQWHGLLVLEEDTVIFEVKHGPYEPLDPNDFAPWSPAEGDDGVEEFVARLQGVVDQVLED